MHSDHSEEFLPPVGKQALPVGCLPLTMARPGEPLTLVEITANNGLRHRLTELGLTPGVEFQVLQSEGGPLLLAVHSSRLAIGRGMAHKILVKVKEHHHG